MSEFKNMKDDFNNIEIPKEIDFIIEAAIKKGKKHKKYKFFKPSIIAAACIIAFVTSINLSPAFANILGGIPGLSNLVKLVSFDKGLYSAVGNGFTMEINKSAVDKDIKFTISNAILDRRKLVIEYTIETTGEYDDLNPGNILIQDESGNNLEVFIDTFLSNDEKFKDIKKKSGIIEVTFPDDSKTFPKNIIVNCKEFIKKDDVYHKKPILGNWKIGFELDSKLVAAEPIVNEINKSVTLNFMKFYIDYIKVYPTKTDVRIRMDENNRYKFVSFKNMRIEDEKGNRYNFRSGSSLSETEHLYGFESSYFEKPKELYFKADGIYCIPKEDAYLVLDVDNKKFIDDSGYNIEYISLNQNSNWADEKYDFLLSFKINDEEILRESKNGDCEGISFYGKAMDENNNEYFITINGTSYGEDHQERFIGIKDMKPLPHLLKFKISGAAKGVYGPISARLK